MKDKDWIKRYFTRGRIKPLTGFKKQKNVRKGVDSPEVKKRHSIMCISVYNIYCHISEAITSLFEANRIHCSGVWNSALACTAGVVARLCSENAVGIWKAGVSLGREKASVEVGWIVLSCTWIYKNRVLPCCFVMSLVGMLSIIITNHRV